MPTDKDGVNACSCVAAPWPADSRTQLVQVPQCAGDIVVHDEDTDRELIVQSVTAASLSA